MIQVKRGSTKSWRSSKTKLAAGQPGYDKDKHKLKIGDGTSSWEALPYASGLLRDDIFSSEAAARVYNALDSENNTIITYGTTAPDKNTVGQLYLQYYDAKPEADYVVESGINGIWSYQKWNSGKARCWGTFDFTTAVQSELGGSLYKNSASMLKIAYPFTFNDIPSEISSIQSPSGLVWLAASKGLNTNKYSAIYNIVSPDSLGTNTYKISLDVKGFWK